MKLSLFQRWHQWNYLVIKNRREVVQLLAKVLKQAMK